MTFPPCPPPYVSCSCPFLNQSLGDVHQLRVTSVSTPLCKCMCGVGGGVGVSGCDQQVGEAQIITSHMPLSPSLGSDFLYVDFILQRLVTII